MKLSEHVDHIRILITAAFEKEFSRLGFGTRRQVELENLPRELLDRRQRFEELLGSHIGETGSYESAREKLVDELTFTLFNRIAAIKVMEAAQLFPPVITKQPEHGDRSFGHKAWLEIRPDLRGEELEGIRDYIQHAFDELGESLPLYSRSYPYAMLPDAINLNEIIEAFNTVEKDPQVEDGIWRSDDVLGWLYESYNNAQKTAFKNSGGKVEYDKVSLQSQVYTPRWVVQFLVDNSLGKLYLEMYPDSEIKKRYKIANAPKTREREPKPLHEVKLIDPACGSGNFLLYSFDLFYALYEDQIENYGAEYAGAEIPRTIIEHNLHGIDLDDRAVQLAQLGLYIKARKKRRSIGNLHFKVVSSDFYLPEYDTVREIFEEGTNLDRSQKGLIKDIWQDLQNAYKYGSLIRLDEKTRARLKELEAGQSELQPGLFASAEIAAQKDFVESFFANLKKAVEKYASSARSDFLASKTGDAITFLELLNMEFDVAVANPPYTDSADFGLELKTFIEDNYKKPYKFHTNLYASFIKRCFELTNENGKITLIHPRTFMFIKTFEDVRKFILNKTNISVFVDYSLSNLFGAIMVDPAFYVLEKSVKNRNAWFVSLDQYTRTPKEKFKKDYCLEALNDYIAGVQNEHNYTISQDRLKTIKSWPFIYWISDEFRQKFLLTNIKEVCPPKSGLATANNNRFLRFWWELDFKTLSMTSEDGKHWKRYSKGGPYKKWQGNLWLRINWKDNAEVLRNTGRAVFRNEDYYFREGITYSASGSKGTSFRYLPENCIYDVGGASLFPVENNMLFYDLALLNSKLSSYIISCLNPTVNTQVGDIERIPFVGPDYINLPVIDILSRINYRIMQELATYSLYEDEYVKSPLVMIPGIAIEKRIKLFFDYENYLVTQVLLNEAYLDERILKIYKLTQHDKAMVLLREGESIGGLPVSKAALKAYLNEESSMDAFPLDTIKDFIISLPILEFSLEQRELIEREFPSLYQNNNNLEEFCIRHQVNPINVWYWFKQANVIPEQRMHTLAMEFLAEIIREILMVDEDGLIPLVPNAGEKVLLDRVEQKFIERGFNLAQYASFDSLLGRPIDDYLNNHFFADHSDHLNLFMYLPKTPFIWHLSSGSDQGFDCYLIIYKWSRDKLLRLRSVYIENRERALINRQSDLAGNNSAEAQNEKDRIFKQLKEIEEFKGKIDELLAEGYDPILDDGVGKNIAPLQEKKMIPYEVLNPGQLKKYLNVDW